MIRRAARRAWWRADRRRAVAALASLAALASVELVAVPPGAASTRPTRLHHGPSGPVAPAPMLDHGYRHGLVLRRGSPSASTAAPASRVDRASRVGGAPRATVDLLQYGGGDSGLPGDPGVMTAPARVYLVFWGTQWGAQGSNGTYATFTGDPSGIAPVLQAFFAGLGTDGELWSGVMTQYCEGVVVGATSCPGPPATTGDATVAYPLGGTLAGVWEDTRGPAPQTATGTQLAQEAVDGATHFGNTTFSSNRDAQYVVVSPHGTDPDDYEGLVSPPGFCAWHDYSSDSTLDGGGGVSSSNGPVVFVNMPYLPDAGAACGAGFVNGASGALDGVTLVASHEYAESLTDPYPLTGWSDADGNEAADKCEWRNTGSGASRDLTLATGVFPVQTTWANDAGACEFSHDIVSDVQFGQPGAQSSVVGTPVSLPVRATDAVAGRSLSYSAVGLPAGLGIDPVSGTITGTPTTAQAAGSASVFATDGTEVGSITFLWTVHPACTPQLLGNPGFETGTPAPWTATPGVVTAATAAEPAHSGQYLALLTKVGRRTSESLEQEVTVLPWCTTDTLSFWLHIDTSRASATAVDSLTVELTGKHGTSVLATYSNLDAATYASGYRQVSFDVSSTAGTKAKVRFLLRESMAPGKTDFAVDDVAFASAG